ncbi:hypothetical protein D3C84_972220 [compost metagenome]
MELLWCQKSFRFHLEEKVYLRPYHLNNEYQHQMSFLHLNQMYIAAIRHLQYMQHENH